MPVIELEQYHPPTAVVRRDSTGAKIHLREHDGGILCGADKKLIADVWQEVPSPPADDPAWCKRCRAAEQSIPRLKRVAGASGTALREKAAAAQMAAHSVDRMLADPAFVAAMIANTMPDVMTHQIESDMGGQHTRVILELRTGEFYRVAVTRLTKFDTAKTGSEWHP